MKEFYIDKKTKNNFTRSPIFYMGNKYKLLPYINELIPKDIKLLVDLFGGSGVVSMNIDAKKKMYNDFNKNISHLLKIFKDNNPTILNEYFLQRKDEFNLTRSPKRAECNSEEDFLKTINKNKDNYNKFRKHYNENTNKDYKDLYLLSCYSMNHLIRFNQKNEFNASCGATQDYNDRIYKQIEFANEKLKDVHIFCDDYKKITRKILEKKISQNTFFYLDPPYLNTNAVYNEKEAFGGWNIDNDYEMFELLEELDALGYKWGLSNVFTNRGKENSHLIEWCKNNNWNVYHLERNYNPFSKGNSNNDEVYVTNHSTKTEITKELLK